MGKKLYNALPAISLNQDKITEAIEIFEKKEEELSEFENEEKALEIYKLMLDTNGTSKLKSIVSQCLSAILRWNIIEENNGVNQEYMFDLDLYSLKIDRNKKEELKNKIENDYYLEYIVNAIKYAAGEDL